MNNNVTLSVKQIFAAATLIVIFTSSVFLVGFQFGSKNVGAVPSGVTSSYLPLSKGGTGDNKFIGNDATHALAGNTKASDIGGASYLKITDWSVNALKNLDLIESHVYSVFSTTTAINTPSAYKFAGTIFKDGNAIYINITSAADPSTYGRKITIGATDTDTGWKVIAGHTITGSISWSTGSLTRANVRQNGNQVYVNFDFSSINLPTTRTKIGTISGVSMPYETLNCIGFVNGSDNQVRFEINASGEIYIDAGTAQSNKAVVSTCTYIVP